MKNFLATATAIAAIGFCAAVTLSPAYAEQSEHTTRIKRVVPQQRYSESRDFEHRRFEHRYRYHNGYRRTDGRVYCNGIWLPIVGPVGCL